MPASTRVTQVLALSLSCGLAAGCGVLKKKKKASVASAQDDPNLLPFLTAADLAAGTTVVPLIPNDAKASVEGDALLEAARSKTPPKDKSLNKCISDAIDAVKAAATTANFSAGATTDITACAAASDDLKPDPSAYPDGVIKDVKAAVRIVELITCNGADLSSYDQQGLGTLLDTNLCPKASTQTELNNSEINLSYTLSGTKTGTPFSSQFTLRTVQAATNADLSPCRSSLQADQNQLQDGCVTVYREIQSVVNKIQGQADQIITNELFEKLVANQLRVPSDVTLVWYAGGAMDVTYNDWTGSVTYTDTKTPPTYTLKNNAQTITGTVAAASAALGLGLTGATARPLRLPRLIRP